MIKRFEKGIIVTLIALMVLVVFITTIELVVLIIKDIWDPPRYWLGIDQLFDVFGFFLVLLIGLELLETIKAYLSENVVHSEIVLEVALIAIARKVIILNVKEYEPMTMIGIASLILAIAVAFLFIKRCRISLMGMKQTCDGADVKLFDD
ncbi:MAG: phosphate-starvation-inducible PsiE family protein [Thermodesulfobacteriota bacterium]|nr:phosphate-starvation-inducible PsiE family protein [Thermodesulfobacteriota bacterium]